MSRQPEQLPHENHEGRSDHQTRFNQGRLLPFPTLTRSQQCTKPHLDAPAPILTTFGTAIQARQQHLCLRWITGTPSSQPSTLCFQGEVVKQKSVTFSICRAYFCSFTAKSAKTYRTWNSIAARFGVL